MPGSESETAPLAVDAAGQQLTGWQPAITEHAVDHDQQVRLTASLVVVRRQGQVLLVFDRWKQLWELPGGGREEGESARTTAIRELREETGIQTEKLIFAGVTSYRLLPEPRRERLAIFRTEIDHDPVPEFVADEEISRVCWWDGSTALDGDVCPLDSKIIELVAAESADRGLPNDVTQSTYQQSADLYIDRTPGVRGPRQEFLDQLLNGLGRRGSVLEIGSGPGVDADYLESAGLTVQRSDVTPAFVELLRSRGLDARLLDVRHDDLCGPWDAVFANAVLLHLSREDFASAVERIRGALRPGGIFAFTLKVGDGEGWSKRKPQLPRYFVYWTEETLRPVLADTGWSEVEIARPDYPGQLDQWLHVMVRR